MRHQQHPFHRSTAKRAEECLKIILGRPTNDLCAVVQQMIFEILFVPQRS
jgi:hypothetical protein